MRARTILMLTGISILIGACGGAEPGAMAGSTDTPAVAPGNADSSPGTGDSAGQASVAATGHAHAPEGKGEALLVIMQQLGTSMTSLTYGLMTDDRAMVARSAAAIAEHAPIAPKELERIHGALDGEMAEFERLDEAVHGASVQLHQAAEAGRTQDVLTRLNEVQRGCVACHVKFRERLKTTPAR